MIIEMTIKEIIDSVCIILICIESIKLLKRVKKLEDKK